MTASSFEPIERRWRHVPRLACPSLFISDASGVLVLGSAKRSLSTVFLSAAIRGLPATQARSASLSSTPRPWTRHSAAGL
jgi:hypothetical protein